MTRQMHPPAIRIMHWLNALAMLVMVTSGWKIYEDEPLFGTVRFPDAITLGGEAQGALQWHYAGMWLMVANGLAYVAYGLATGRFRRLLLPIRPGELLATLRDALRLRLGHDDLTRYNPVQKAMYVGVLAIGFVQVISGLAIWKPVQFAELTLLFGDFQGARIAHFVGMMAIVLFVFVHATLALIVPQTLRAMLTGNPGGSR
ncbi:MAG: cytochrome b/b6 domain-containing protein [Alphaproteobacteria bacterium]|nr:cytochrome b/b6 domain-containing protein [Alphaproteobacteria bacterium]